MMGRASKDNACPVIIFVFGSNLQGRHAGGAACVATTPACQYDKVGYRKIQQENQ